MALFELACFAFAVLMMLQVRDSNLLSVSPAFGTNSIQYIGDDPAELSLNFFELAVVDFCLSVLLATQASHAIDLKTEDKFMWIFLAGVLGLKFEPYTDCAHGAGEPFLSLSFGAGGAIEAEVDAISAHLFFASNEVVEGGVGEVIFVLNHGI